MLVPDGVTEFEAATSSVFGSEHVPFESPPAKEDPYKVLEQELLAALASPPCVVVFSGDSGSCLALAAAAATADQHRLAPPVPVTFDYGEAGGGADAYQEALVRQLGLPDWERPTAEDDLDFLGDVAQGVMRRHGLLFPSVAHLVVPSLRLARGGILVDTHGLDNVGRVWRGAQLSAIVHRRQVRRGDWRALAALAPRAVRRALARRIVPPLAPDWLRPAAREQWVELALEDVLSAPLSYKRALRSGAGKMAGGADSRRCHRHTSASFSMLARDHDARFVFPFGQPRWVRAVAEAGGHLGWPTAELFARKLVPDLPRRSSPAREVDWRRVWWGQRSRAFADSWDGTGLNDEIVDPEAVRRAWLNGDPRSGTLLQAAWLSSVEARDAQRRSGALVE